MHGGFTTAKHPPTKFSDFNADDTREERARFNATLRAHARTRHDQDSELRDAFPHFFRTTGK